MSRSSTSEARQVRDAAPLFAALGDQTRLRLLVRLTSSGPESISRLSAASPVSRQAVKKHLDVLSRAGLIRGVRRGREHIWEIQPQRLEEARGYLDRISRQWDEALDRLKSFVEER
jgi:DNA-binding transcriptional ArsR family regulator